MNFDFKRLFEKRPTLYYTESTDISRKRWSEQMDMEKLIGETTEYDKKAALEVKKPKSWCKSVSAFANTLGGALIFGMADDGQIVGLTEPDSDAEKINEIIKTRMEPISEFRLLFHKTEDGKVLLILAVFKGEALSLRPFGPQLPLWRKRHLPRIGGVCLPEGGFLTRGGTAFGGPFVGGYILSAARTPTKRELCGDVLENFLLYCRMPGSDWAFIFWLTFAGGQTKSSRMGVKMSSRTPGSRASQPWMMPSVFSIVSPAVTSRTSSPMVKRKRPDTT